MADNSKKFEFSVVIPIYNVEEYLEETILSVIHQTYDFGKHIQIILVNDGSPDNSEAICLEYQKKYPDNIIYIKQENSGVSAARNNGLKYATGKYVNFLDSDDTWEPDAFSNIHNFANAHSDAEIFCCRMQFFEASNRPHPLSDKFTENCIIDIHNKNEFASIHLHVTSSFFKTEFAKTMQFQENMVLGEDALYLNSLILKAGRYAAMADTQHNYRKRAVKTSAIQTKETNLHFYAETIEKFYGGLIKASLDNYNEVIPYIQNLLVYDIGWRVTYPQPKILSQEEFDNYCDDLSKVLSYVEDIYILKSPLHRSICKKRAILKLKYKEDILFGNMTYDKKLKKIFFKDILMANVPKNVNNCEIYNIEHRGKSILVEGLIKKWIVDAKCTTDFGFDFNGKEYPVKLELYPHANEETMFGTDYRYYQFSVEFPFDSIFKKKRTQWLTPYLYFGEEKCPLAMSCSGKRILNTKLCSAAYNIMDDYHFYATPKGVKFFKPEKQFLSHTKAEMKMLKWLIKNKEYGVFFIRILYYVANFFRKKPLWIVSDRQTVSNDNGEAFFRYLSQIKPKDIKFEFVINKDCSDEKRMKAFGKVVHFDSLKFKLHFLLADKVISSQANEYIMNAFSITENYYLRDLIKFDFVFLQHGIILNDLSSWLKKKDKKIDFFVTSAKREQESIINGNYGYGKDKVKLTGLPRFDRLYNQKSNLKKQILIMPTWRRSIIQSYDENNNSVYYDKFNETEYFTFFNDLMNDEKLLKVMREKGYTGKFCLHPIHAKQAVDYDENDIFNVVSGQIDYQSLFTESALMITDFSSTFFDFCYLHKPIIYAQFDREAFYAGQIYDEGYFKYDCDGFGPVCESYGDTLEEIIKAIKNNCALEPVYEKRISDFYAYSDNKNCERIYNEIRKMK